jgi:two-component system, NarL family, sensor histidine kinase UhpB
MGLVTLALIAGLGAGGVMTVRQARQSVANEVGSAFLVGRQTLETEIENLPAGPDRAADLRQLIAAFDGNRHIRVSLLGKDGKPVATSTLASAADRAPLWFVGLIGVPERVEQIDLPPAPAPVSTVRIETDAHNEVLEVWSALQETAALIAALALSCGLLIWWSITRLLRPLSALSKALHSVGAGEFDARLLAGGLPETQVIASAFNRMAEDLSVAHEHNRTLYSQLLTAQEVERKDIARDLHDDIGPLLLAISIDAAALEGRIAPGDADAVSTLRSITATIGEAQQHIRAIVNRLRPIGLAEFGLREAIENLVAFWQHRQPHVDFTFDVDPDFQTLDELGDITVFRVVQESLSNALRHGEPTRIRIKLRFETLSQDALGVEIADDGKGASGLKPGFGLTGIKERVEAAGGRLMTNSAAGGGFTVTAILPTRGHGVSPVPARGIAVAR